MVFMNELKYCLVGGVKQTLGWEEEGARRHSVYLLY